MFEALAETAISARERAAQRRNAAAPREKLSAGATVAVLFSSHLPAIRCAEGTFPPIRMLFYL